MFDRYNQPARRSLFFARYEAGVLGSEAIEPEHLLVGILKQRESLFQRMIGSADLSANDVRQRIQQRIGSHRPRVNDSTEIPFSEDAKRVFELTAEESDRLLHRHVGTEHLLLGLLRLERGLAWDMLREAGLSLTPVREALVMQVSATSPPTLEIEGMLAGMSHGRIERTRQASAAVYNMTALDGPNPGRRAADEGGSNAFASFTIVDFSTRTDEGSDRGIHSIGPISMSGTSLSDFANVLEDFLGEPVLDDTGLSGLFDIELQGTYDSADALIAALRDQLGLVLTRGL